MNINEYPYTNLVYQNIDWLINEVNKLKNQGKTVEETTESVNKSIFAGAGTLNAYPYTNLVYQNIDWLIKTVYNLCERMTNAETAITDIRKELLNLAEDDKKLQDNIDTLQLYIDAELNKKVDKTTQNYKIYGTDGNGQQVTYDQTVDPFAYTIPLRSENGNVHTATLPDDDDAAINYYYLKEYYLLKSNQSDTIYGVKSDGGQYQYPLRSGAVQSSIALRGTNATLKVSKATQDDEAVNLSQLNTAIEESKQYADTHGGGGWKTVAEVVAETDTELLPVEYNPHNEDLTAIKISMYAESAEDVNANPYDEHVAINFTDAYGENGVAVATITNCLPTVFSKAKETSKTVTLENTWLQYDGNYFPQNTTVDAALGKNAINHPTTITAGGTSKINILGTDYTIDSYLTNRTVRMCELTRVTGDSVSRPDATINTTLPPNSTTEDVYEYQTGDATGTSAYTTPIDNRYLEKVMSTGALEPYSLAGEEYQPYTINFIDTKSQLEGDNFYYYDFTIANSNIGEAYLFRWYSSDQSNTRQYAHIYQYKGMGSAAYAPADLALRIRSVELPEYTDTVTVTGFYSSEKPDYVIYIDESGKIYANNTDITACTMSYTEEVPTHYKGIFNAEISLYGENAQCTRIEGTSENLEKFDQTVEINNQGTKFACSTKPYINVELNTGNKLYAGSKIRIETISTRDKE